MDALRYRDDAAPETRISLFHVRQEFFQDEGSFRQINQMRSILGKLLAERRRGGQEAGVPAHDDADIDAGQGRVIQVCAGKRLRHETRSRRKAGRVIAADQIIVDGFRNVNAAQRIACLLRLEADDAHGVR